MRPHGRSRTIRTAPRAHAVCDRCGFLYDHSMLTWQFDWRGPHKQNLRILVCRSCLDVPQEQLRTIVLPPDPAPIENPRPETYASDDNPISPLGWDANRLYPPQATFNPANFGTMTSGGGVDAAFFGAPNKVQGQCALTLVSNSSFQNSVSKNWSALPGAPTTPSSLAPPTQSYTISGVTAYAPLNTPFLLSGATGYQFNGSNDGVSWTTLYTGTTAGTIAEILTIPSTGLLSQPYYAFHQFVLQGDGINPVAISLLELNTVGQSQAATGSELGA